MILPCTEVEVIAHVDSTESHLAECLDFKLDPERKVWFKIMKEKHFETDRENYIFNFSVNEVKQ